MIKNSSSPISSILNVSQGNSCMGKSIDLAYAEYCVMEYINKMEWVLPVKSIFQYLEDQKKILYGLFIKVQKSKKKETTEKLVAESPCR